MKKELCSLIFGAIFLTSPLESVGQEPKKDNYEYDLLWRGFNLGGAVCNSDTVSFNLKGIHDLNFYKTKKTYQEISKFIDSEETYFYVKKGDNWKFKNYFYPIEGNKNISKKRQNKIDLVGEIYDSEVIVGSKIFEEFEKKDIPDTLKLVVFGEVYTFGKKSENNLRENLVEVQYNLPYFPKYESDKVRLKEPVRIYLEKQGDGSHLIVGGKANIQYKLGLWFNFKLDVVEKNYWKE